MIGVRLRFFSRRTFGVWVEATVTRVSKTRITLDCCHCGVQWLERVPLNTTFFRPRGHPEAGEEFRLFDGDGKPVEESAGAID